MFVARGPPVFFVNCYREQFDKRNKFPKTLKYTSSNHWGEINYRHFYRLSPPVSRGLLHTIEFSLWWYNPMFRQIRWRKLSIGLYGGFIYWGMPPQVSRGVLHTLEFSLWWYNSLFRQIRWRKLSIRLFGRFIYWWMPPPMSRGALHTIAFSLWWFISMLRQFWWNKLPSKHQGTIKNWINTHGWCCLSSMPVGWLLHTFAFSLWW